MKKLSFVLITIFVLLSACAGNTNSLEGEWELVSYGGTENPTDALPEVDTSINFDANGQFGGTVGCNTLSGGYRVDGDEITFDEIVSTLMACEETLDQETLVLSILTEQTLKYQIDGNRLTMNSLDGTAMVTLQRK